MKIAIAIVLLIAIPVRAQDRAFPEFDAEKTLKFLEHRNADIRLFAVVECGIHKLAPSEPLLKKLLETETSAMVRTAAEWSLLSIRGKDKELAESLRKAVTSDDKKIRECCAPFCAVIGDKAIELLEALCDANPDDYYHFSKALAVSASADGSTLLPYLKSKNKHVRSQACSAAGGLLFQSRKRDPRLLARLVELLADRKCEVDEDAAKALSNGGPDAVVLLRRALKDKDGNVRMNAAYALGCMDEVDEGGAAAEPELLECLRDVDSKVRVAAASAFDRLGLKNAKAVAPLINCLRDMDHEVRDAAARALGGLGRVAIKAEPDLLKAAKSDSQVHVRARAVEALSKVAPDNKELISLTLAMLEDSHERQIAFRVLGDLQLRAKPAIKDVRPFVTDKDQDTQAQAIGTLLLIGGDEKEVQAHVRRLLKESWYRPIRTLLDDCEKAGDRAKFLAPEIAAAYHGTKDPALQRLLANSLQKIDPASRKKLK